VWLHIRQFNGNCLRVHFGEPQRLDEALARWRNDERVECDLVYEFTQIMVTYWRLLL
jgi:hypothetical protein